MARFTILQTRKLQNMQSEFDVRVLSGELSEGDTFSARGAYQHSEFRVQIVRAAPDLTTLVCAGEVAFDGEFTRVTLDAHVPRLPPSSLPMPAHFPTPTPEEEQLLQRVIEDWETRAPVQRAACLCPARGDDTPEKIAHRLGLTAEEIRIVFKGVSGVLYDHSGDKLFIR